jgi:ankyrin repeat protein
MTNSDLVTIYMRLYDEMKQDDWDYIESLKSSRFNFSLLNESPSHLSVILNGAVKYNKNDYFIALCEAGVDAFTKETNESGQIINQNALHVAAKTNNIELVKYILAQDSAKDSIDIGTLYDESALFLATQKNNAACVKLLLDKGANYLLDNDNNSNALNQAIMCANLDTFKHYAAIIDKNELLNQIKESNNKHKGEIIDYLISSIEKEQLEATIHVAHKTKSFKL